MLRARRTSTCRPSSRSSCSRGDAPDGTIGARRLPGRGRVGRRRPTRHARIDAITPDDLSDIIFTSGTTGRPKGVMITHGQIAARLRGVDRGHRAARGRPLPDRQPVLPHLRVQGGLDVVRAARRDDRPVPGVRRPDGARDGRSASGSRCSPARRRSTRASSTSPIARQYDLSSLRLAVTGAAAVPVELVERLRDEMTFETIITGYGLTESTGTTAMCRHDDEPETIANTSGRAIPDTEVRVVDDDGNEVPRGEPGEVVVRGYNVMRGYFEEPEETDGDDRRRRLAAHRRHRGDGRARLPAHHRPQEGHVHRRRVQRLSRPRSRTCSCGNEALAQVAVVGVPDERLGEVGMAFVDPAAGRERRPRRGLHRVGPRRRWPTTRSPRYVEVVDTLPMNAERQGPEVRAP